MLRWLHSGLRALKLGATQWAPTRTSHDPNPPITLENPAGSTPQTLIAVACSVAIAAGAASLIQDAQLAAGGQAVTVTAPAASIAVQLAAGGQAVTLSAPTATSSASVQLAAGGQVLTLSAPTATSSASVQLAAGGQVVQLEAPAASLAVQLPAGGQVVQLEAPVAQLLVAAPVVLGAAACELQLEAPLADLVEADTSPAPQPMGLASWPLRRDVVVVRFPRPVALAAAGAATLEVAAPVARLVVAFPSALEAARDEEDDELAILLALL